MSFDKQEAEAVLVGVLGEFRELGYQTLVARLADSEPETFERMGLSGQAYQLEVMGVWDDEKRGDLRVIAMLDDAGWRAFRPTGMDFIIRRDGSFVDDAAPDPPLIFVDREGEIFVAASVKEAQGQLEAIDVAGGEYRGFDALGRRLRLGTSSQCPPSSFRDRLRRVFAVEGVNIELVEPQATGGEAEARSALTAYLKRYGRYPGDDVALAELAERAR